MQARIYGVERLKKKLGTKEFRERFRRGVEQALLFVHGSLPGYPPPPPGSRYRRTGMLGKSITTRVEEGRRKITGIIGTALRYAPYVISTTRTRDGRGPQAWMHRGRWWTLQDEVRARKDDIIRIIRESLKFGG